MIALEASHLSERWTLTVADHVLIAARSRANRQGFAVFLHFIREHGRFPADVSEGDRPTACEVARPVHVPLPEDHGRNFSGRTVERHRTGGRSSNPAT